MCLPQVSVIMEIKCKDRVPKDVTYRRGMQLRTKKQRTKFERHAVSALMSGIHVKSKSTEGEISSLYKLISSSSQVHGLGQWFPNVFSSISILV
jgi:hypothetical protein